MLPSRRPSSSQSPTESRDRVRDRDRELGHEYEHEEHDRRSLKRSRRDSLSPPVLSAHSHGGTSLPSIHHLHPDLPPAGQQRHTAHTQYGPSEFLPGPSYASRPFFPPGQAAAASTAYPHPYDERRLFERPLPGPSSLPASSEQRMSPGAESDQDQNESERLGPPKKKRRRQALSCTECKRRKIKCDRTHPCGPCTRRNEPNKCQWHVIEPVEKYVTRTEWDELFSRYRLLEDRCLRLEQLIVHLHPEFSVHLPYEITTTGNTAGLPALASPSTRPMTNPRGFPLAGPGVSGASQRRTPTTPLSALPSPGKGSAAVYGRGIGAGTDTEASVSSARSGSAPPPQPQPRPLAETTATQPSSHSSSGTHPLQNTDRRTCASGLHGYVSASSSERPTLHHQIPVSISSPVLAPTPPRGPPVVAPTVRSYTFPPPPPPHASPRPRESNTHGHSGRSPSLSARPVLNSNPDLNRMDTSPRSARRMVQPRPQSYASQSPRTHRTRPGIFTRDDIGPRPEPAGASNSAHPNSRFVGQQPHQYEYAHVFMQQQYREQEQLQRLPPSPLRARAHERDLDSKNGEAQTFKADDVLRRRSIPSPRSGYPSRASVGRPHSASPVSTSYSTTRQSSTDAESDDKMDVSRSDAENIGSATASSKRARRTSLYLTIPASASKPASPPPVLFIH